MATLTEQLESVQTAIATIESGAQSYAIGSRSLSRANLKDLYEREKYLLRQIEREESGGIKCGYIIPS